MKKFIALVMAMAMTLSLFAGCAKEETPTTAAPTTAAPTTAAPTTAAPTEAVDAELEAWKAEPAYGQTIKYWMSDGCTSGPAVADYLGYFEEEGIKVESFKGTSYTEALGTNQAQIAVGHIATMLVPSTNGVDLTFVGGAHVGCKSLYVLADSGIETTQDLIGKNISVPNGIGASDYNITCCLLDSDGINPLKDVKLMQVENSACVAAMQNGEIASALLSDTYAWKFVQDGTLKKVRSLFDEDWMTTPCCVVAMNATFVKENPITAKKIATAVQKAQEWMGQNPEETTDYLLEQGLNSGDRQMNIDINTAMDFYLNDDFTQAGLEKIADIYIRMGIITSMKTVDEVMAKAWTPIVGNLD